MRVKALLETASGRFVLCHERRPQSGLDSNHLRSQNDIRERPTFARKLLSAFGVSEVLESSRQSALRRAIRVSNRREFPDPNRQTMNMATSESTCWTIIRAGAAGSPADRDELGRRYMGLVQAYLSARWRGSTLRKNLDDATQEVFIECFRQGGVLETAGAGRVPNFRAFLYGVIRNVARRFECQTSRAVEPLPDVEAKEASLSQLFERSWAESIMAEAAKVQKSRAADGGVEAIRRVELLRLRFEENLPIREIAQRWNIDPAQLHRDYALARQEFRAALLEVVAFHHPGSPSEVEIEAAGLLKSLS